MKERGNTLVIILLAIVLLGTIVFVYIQSQRISALHNYIGQLHSWMSQPPPNAGDPPSVFPTLREWQIRITDVVCRLERLDATHVGGGVILLCPDPNQPPPDPRGAPPPPPDFG